MSILGIFILTTAIGMEASREPAAEKRDAYKALAKATYIETGANKKLKELEKRYIPKDIKEYSGIISGVIKITTEQKFSIEWTF